MIFARKTNKIPKFYTIFVRKMPEFYIIIARKIFSPKFGGGGSTSYENNKAEGLLILI